MKRRGWLGADAKQLMEQTGESDPGRAIAKMTRDLVDEACLDEPPFDPRVLASFRRVQDIRPRLMSSAARLVPEGDKLFIDVNQDHSRGKRNFSIDHEVTHTLLPTYSGNAVDDADTGRFTAGPEAERLCDLGAANLLLDTRWLLPIALQAGPSMNTVFLAATTFDASLQASAFRLAEIGPWSCAFVVWEWRHKKGGRIPDGQPIMPGFEPLGRPKPKLRVACCYRSASFRYWIPLNKSVDGDSLIAECCQSDARTWGEQTFDLGRETARLYCENAFVPYRRGGELRERVISLLLPSRLVAAPTSTGPMQYQLEVL